ncbi:MAG: D-2-hydroxyacid dehydrogenase [Theionarchaea archaeon]|nr:D-2-hydroxyacid dehydrogenase [Theionarchaea archaeon]
MVTILFTRHYDMLTEHHIKTIESLSEDIHVLVEENVLDVIGEVDILIAGKFDAQILQKATKLKWVHALAAGVDRLLFPEFVNSPIMLTNSSGVHPIPISEHVLGIMLMFTRGFHESMRSQFQKKWERSTPSELYGKTLGIVGFGSIGERVGQLGKCCGMRVIGLKRNVDYATASADEILPPDNLDILLGQSDFVVISLPLTPQTTHYISLKELKKMKNTAYFINISRGKTVKQADLIHALQSGIIQGTGLDVFEEESLPPDSPLWEMKNVIITPHYAGSTPEYFNRAISIFCNNLEQYLKGEPLLNLVDKKRGY